MGLLLVGDASLYLLLVLTEAFDFHLLVLLLLELEGDGPYLVLKLLFALLQLVKLLEELSGAGECLEHGREVLLGERKQLVLIEAKVTDAQVELLDAALVLVEYARTFPAILNNGIL